MPKGAEAGLIAAAFLLTGAAGGPPAEAVLLPHENLAWVQMIPGVEFAAAYGDWTEEAHGKFVRFASGAAVPLHTHSGAYRGVMISGRLTNPYPGETAPAEMGPGDYWYVPAGAPHENVCVSAEPCVFYTHADGPWDVEIIAP